MEKKPERGMLSYGEAKSQIKWPFEFPGAYWLDSREDEAVLDVLHNGSLYRYYGVNKPQYVDAYEAAAREYYGVKHALAVNSGTGALTTAIAALGIGPGCEVILPSFMWVATVGAVIMANAIPVICEIDDSFSMDPLDLEKKITPRTKLIIPVHMAGNPCNIEAIMGVANRHGIPVLEDVAQCNGGSFKGKKLGTFGSMGVFSIQLNKTMTCGEGGLVITNDDKLYERAFAAHDMGMVRVEGRLALPRPDALSWGAGRRMGELCGAVASVQLKKLPEITNHMRASKNRIKAMLKDVLGITFRKINDADGEPGPFLIITLESEVKALKATEKIKEAGLHNVYRLADYGLHIYYNIPSLVKKIPISPSGNPWNLSENVKSVYDYNKGACPISDDLFARSVLIPIPSRLTEEQERFAASAIKKAVETLEPISLSTR
jgi:8-amino-3,8-dideoxy-alpha-D-manno-octulosonate transaminase